MPLPIKFLKGSGGIFSRVSISSALTYEKRFFQTASSSVRSEKSTPAFTSPPLWHCAQRCSNKRTARCVSLACAKAGRFAASNPSRTKSVTDRVIDLNVIPPCANFIRSTLYAKIVYLFNVRHKLGKNPFGQRR